MSRESDVVRVLKPYLAAFPQAKINEGTLFVYARALADFPPTLIDAAMLKLLRTLKFFPSVAEIIEAAEGIVELAEGKSLPTPAEAWGEAMREARAKFVYRPWELSCPEVEKTVEAFGKMDLCTLEETAINTARAQFMRMYQQIVERKEERRQNEAVLTALPGNVRALIGKTVGQREAI